MININKHINNIKMSVRAGSAICNFNWSGDATDNNFRSDAIVTVRDLRAKILAGQLSHKTTRNLGARTMQELCDIAGVPMPAKLKVYPPKICRCPQCGNEFKVKGTIINRP